MRLPITFLALIALAWVSPAGAAVSETEIRALVGRWVDCQNAQDFAAYAKLYSKSFKGVRKSGDREVRLDYASWLADRGRMFKRPFKVSIENLEVKAGPGGPEVDFLQKWESSSYADRGWKTLRIVEEDGGPKIVEERMTSSEKQIATPRTFAELLAKTEGVAPSWFEDVTLKRSAKGFDFSFVRSQGEGGDESYSGSYRSDGTLDTVTQEVDYDEHSMGPANRQFTGTLTRRYSPEGKLLQVTGNLRIQKLKTGKVTSNRKITTLSGEDAEHFGTKLPPLKVPRELLR